MRMIDKSRGISVLHWSLVCVTYDKETKERNVFMITSGTRPTTANDAPQALAPIRALQDILRAEARAAGKDPEAIVFKARLQTDARLASF